jgi:hypothetical protein
MSGPSHLVMREREETASLSRGSPLLAEADSRDGLAP